MNFVMCSDAVQAAKFFKEVSKNGSSLRPSQNNRVNSYERNFRGSRNELPRGESMMMTNERRKADGRKSNPYPRNERHRQDVRPYPQTERMRNDYQQRPRFNLPSHRGRSNGRRFLNTPIDPKRKFVSNPTFQELALFGDSILVRFAKRQQIFADRYTSPCFGGATIQSLICRVQETLKTMPSKIILMIGSNDVLQGAKLEDMVKQLHDLLGIILNNGCDHLLLCTIPPICKDKQTCKRKTLIEAYNQEIRDIVTANPEIVLVDTYPCFMQDTEWSVINEELFEQFHWNGMIDLVHPNEAGLRSIHGILQEILSE